MSTTTAELPVGSIEPTSTEVAMAKSVSWIRGTYEKGKDLVVRGWKAFLRGLRWAKDKIVAAARWTKDKLVAAGRWVKSHAGTAKDWVVNHAKSSWAWIKEAAIGAWEFAAPFRNWVATPFRLALTTSGGLGALLLFGGKTVVLFTLVWLGFLLFSGRLRVADKPVQVKTDENGRMVLTEAQVDVLGRRDEALQARMDAAPLDNSGRLKSELTGRIWVIQQRLKGIRDVPSKMEVTFKEYMLHEVGGQEMLDNALHWPSVKKGLRDEHKHVNTLLEKAASVEAAATK